MNLRDDPTVGQLKRIFAVCNGGAYRYLIWIDKQWNVCVQRFRRFDSIPEWKSRKRDDALGFGSQIWNHGDHLIGTKAVSNDAYMRERFSQLLDFRDGKVQTLIE